MPQQLLEFGDQGNDFWHFQGPADSGRRSHRYVKTAKGRVRTPASRALLGRPWPEAAGPCAAPASCYMVRALMGSHNGRLGSIGFMRVGPPGPALFCLRGLVVNAELVQGCCHVRAGVDGL